MSTIERPNPVTQQGYFSIAWDDSQVYSLGVFDQPQESVLATLPTESEEWWNEDTLEVFFRLTPGSEALHFALNPLGTRFGAEISGTAYQVVGRVEADRWIVALAFPLGKQLPPLETENVWELKVARANI
jgi:hypothetical protein